MEKVRRTAVVYFLLQGFAVVGWWAVLIGWPEGRRFFQLDPDSQTSLMAFWLADLAFIAIASLIAAYLVKNGIRYMIPALWFVAGAVSYAAVYTFSYAMMTDIGWLGVVMMMPAMLWTGVFAMAMTVGNDMFRPARPSSENYVILKTFTQIIVIWTVILVMFPYLLTIVEDKLGIARFEFPFQRPLAAVLFLVLSSVGIYAAFVMSRIGKGTPLPIDHALDLVVKGPYARVRNPMAVSGVGQGLAVALFLGSPLVAVYALMGSAIWQLIFRPMEEDDLAARFGEPYNAYLRAVKCWIPRLNAYRPNTIDGGLKNDQEGPELI